MFGPMRTSQQDPGGVLAQILGLNQPTGQPDPMRPSPVQGPSMAAPVMAAPPNQPQAIISPAKGPLGKALMGGK